jgi:hypothetical protein
MTLLEMVQDILSDMDSDHVNTIGDSIEAQQIATIIKNTYFWMIDNVLDLPEHAELLTLTALGDTTHPTYFSIPTDVKRIDYLRYNSEDLVDTDLDYRDLKWLPPRDFEKMVNSRNESDTNVSLIVDFNHGSLLIENDKMPQWWTSFDDFYIVMDSYDSAVESTLQQSKLLGWGLKQPAWSTVDTFVPDLDTNIFPLLYNEAKAACFIDIKQVQNIKAERRSRDQITRIHNKTHTTPRDRHAEQPNYGRHGRSTTKRPIDIAQ